MKRLVAALAVALTLVVAPSAGAGAAQPSAADHITCVVVDQLNTTWCLDRLPLPAWPLI